LNKYISFTLFILILITRGNANLNINKNFENLLPDEINGWSHNHEDEVYIPDNLHDYINGGAELYISFGFEKVLSRYYSRENQSDIIVEIFDMGSTKNALGIFLHSREKIENDFGQGSQYFDGLLLFWKNRYYVSVLASPETKESKAAIFALAQQIDSKIKVDNNLPEIINLLPPEKLIESSIRYFSHHAWLNSYYFIAHENILHIDKTCEAVLAKYEFDQKPAVLVIVKYPTAEKTQQAKKNFVQEFVPDIGGKKSMQIEDKRWLTVQDKNEYMVIVFNSPDATISENLVNEVILKIH